MKTWTITKLLSYASIWLLAGMSAACAEEVPIEYKPPIQKGLVWLARQQLVDGRWMANGGNPYPEAMTGLSGVALLMEGSTLRDGKYANSLRRAVQWCISRSQPSGLIGDPKDGGHYMYGHGYAMLFLASVYGEEGDGKLRRELEDVLTRAVIFSGGAQSKYGGWHYVSAADGGEGGDSSATATQMQGLRAARDAGIVVPKEMIDRGLDYLRQTTNGDGGVSYGWHQKGQSRAALTVAALASSFSAGEYKSDLVKKWMYYCQKHIPTGGARMGHDEYTYCYMSQVLYNLGSDRYAELFPDESSDRMTWSAYRKLLFDRLVKMQARDGSWRGSGIGEVYDTSVRLIVMQLDNAVLPIFQR